ncbi:hypothetical protein SKAU_G00379170 [Synaphobranchus kaupii]|uniref:Uncharacterized protein n=1 Tax=Synaphobranchus kaupii TaxID=118154 RepID=A0A9Q1ED93_SYNKA|nr:hypothetical protein SKAU_G00379170 [Synaphobranchus kaupii]
MIPPWTAMEETAPYSRASKVSRWGDGGPGVKAVWTSYCKMHFGSNRDAAEASGYLCHLSPAPFRTSNCQMQPPLFRIIPLLFMSVAMPLRAESHSHRVSVCTPGSHSDAASRDPLPSGSGPPAA